VFGSGAGSGQAAEMKSISCNPKNAAKLKDPGDNIVKAIWVLFLD